MNYFPSAEYVLIQKDSKRPASKNWNAHIMSEVEFDSNCITHNIAMVAGEKWVILDVEGPRKGGANGLTHLRALERANGSLPFAPHYQTPSGGYGYIFKQSGGAVPFVDLSATHGLELRTGKHYSLLPPSTFVGEKYSGNYDWITTPQDVLDSEGDFPDVPAWLVSFFLENVTKADANLSDGKVTDYHKPCYLSLIENNIFRLNPRMNYHEWWRVMAVCHRADAKEVFLEWSKSGGPKFQTEQNLKFIDSQWNALDRSAARKAEDGQPLIGATWFWGKVCEVDPEPEPVCQVEERIVFEGTIEGQKQYAVPCSGLVAEINRQVQSQLPHQSMYGHLAALCILGTLAQRRVRPKTKPMGYYALYTPPNAQKTTLHQCIFSTVERILPLSCMPHPASAQALQDLFAEEASRYYGSDEAIARMLAVAENKYAQSTPKAEMYTLMLEYFGNPKTVHGQRNKKKEDSSKSSKHPRLTWLAVGTSSQWKKLIGTDEFINAGYASRFAPFTGEKKVESYLEFKARQSSDVTLDDDTIDALRELYGAYVCASDHEPVLVDIKEPQELTTDQEFIQEMERREREETRDGVESIWGRMKERVNWYATLHCYGRGNYVIDEEDLAYGVALCQYHVGLWDEALGMAAQDDVTACMEAVMAIVKKQKVITMSDAHHYIAAKFRGKDHTKLRKEAFELLVSDGRLAHVSGTRGKFRMP